MPLPGNGKAALGRGQASLASPGHPRQLPCFTRIVRAETSQRFKFLVALSSGWVWRTARPRKPYSAARLCLLPYPSPCKAEQKFHSPQLPSLTSHGSQQPLLASPPVLYSFCQVGCLARDRGQFEALVASTILKRFNSQSNTIYIYPGKNSENMIFSVSGLDKCTPC